MKKSLVVAAAVLSFAAGASYAEAAGSSSFGSHDSGQAIFAGRSGAVTTGRVGMNMHSVILPNGGQGLLRDNGNGTSTLIGPGSVTTLPTPAY